MERISSEEPVMGPSERDLEIKGSSPLNERDVRLP